MAKVCDMTSCKNTASGFLLLMIWQTFLVLSRIFLSSRPSTFHDKTVKFGLLCSSFCSLEENQNVTPLVNLWLLKTQVEQAENSSLNWKWSYAKSGHNMRIHPHNQNLDSPRPRHLSFKQLCNRWRGCGGGGGLWEGGWEVYLGLLWEGYVLPRLHWDHIFYSKWKPFLEVKADDILLTVTILFAGGYCETFRKSYQILHIMFQVMRTC